MHNTIQQIKASAGSGKTHTIINTFLKHLSDNQENIEDVFSSILAITFTNSAAADMKSKLIARLKSIALGNKDDDRIQLSKEEAVKSIEAFIRHYTALNIRTIDSFLFMLLKQNSINLHLPPQFEPVFDPEDFFKPLLDELAFVALHRSTNPESDEAKILKPYYEKMYKTLYYTSERKGFLGLDHVRKKILDVCTLLAQLPDDLIARLSSEEEIADAYTKKMLEYGEIVYKISNLVDVSQMEQKKVYTEAMEKFEVSSKVIRAFSVGNGTAKSAGIIYSLFYQKSITAIRKTEKGQEILDELEDLFDALELVYKPAFLYEQALEYAPLLPLAKIILEMQAYEEFSKGKILSERISNLLDTLIHCENSHLPQMLERLPFQLNSILIDEFQDTSSSQWNLIRPFSEEVLSRDGALTYVGDVKQAIYSWRGGNSSLFEGVLAEVRGEVEKIRLETNWRSSPVVVEFNNLIFSQFKEKAFCEAISFAKGMARPEEPSFSTTLANIFSDVEQGIAPKYNGNTEEGRVFIHTITPKDYRGNTALYEALRPRLCNAVKERNKEFNYGEMAVLVRGNKESKLFAEWLTAEGIPVITEGALNIASNFLVSQCISLLEYLKDSNNELALWHVVGFAGLFDEEVILPLESFIKAKKKKISLLNVIHEENESLYNILQEIIEESKNISVYLLLSQIIERTNLFAKYSSQSGFIARLLELALQAQNKGIYSIVRFLDYWYDEGQEEKIPMPEGIDAVRILTIHKSKGAEFNVVFVFDKGIVKGIDGIKAYDYDGLSFIAPHSHYHEDYSADAKIEAIEVINLLYVAFTRAKKELHTFYLKTKEEDTALEYMLKMPLESASPCDALNALMFGKELSTDIMQDKDESVKGEKAEKALPRLQYRMPKLNFEELEESAFYTLTPKRRGNLVHACLEHYFRLAHFDKDCDDRIIAMLLDSKAIESNEKKNLKNEITAYLKWLKSFEDFDTWCKKAVVEQSLVDDQGLVCRCDLYFEKADSVRIIDFKTGEENEKYHKQIRHYAAVLNKMPLYKDKRFTGALYYLDSEKVVEVDCGAI